MAGPNGNGNGTDHGPGETDQERRERLRRWLGQAERGEEKARAGSIDPARSHSASTAEPFPGHAPSTARKPRPERRGDLIFRAAGNFERRPLSWLWGRRVLSGGLNLFTGDKGAGKSTLLTMMAAIVSRGGRWPDDPGHPAPRGTVLYLNAEEGNEDTLAPRLAAFGADMDRVLIFEAVRLYDEGGEVGFSLGHDLKSLEDVIVARGDVRLVLIDTITSYFGSGVNEHKASDVRRVLEPFRRLAARAEFAVGMANHMNKGTGSNALHRSSDSIAIPSLCRMTWLVARDPDDRGRSLLVPSRCNIPPRPALAFRISQEDDGTDDFRPRFEWEPGLIEGLGADQVLARESFLLSVQEKKGPKGTKTMADLFIAGRLDAEPLLSELNAEGREIGLDRAAVYRALKRAGAKDFESPEGVRYRKAPQLKLGSPE